ncbi:7-deoxyloganetic acid glucosyltransferase-like [Ziziphus jujuba]|uniref:7-deoxyloganetic acid glucosyltransferase-like n=1 Tax=Ziziphus jujuba TaxID=326968 RepID=A0ABM4A3Y6_ZIZJJ|nr:7-deoxyloganetic acid glucosyltransferase-like [Ziziphus jujuba]
MPLIGKQIKIAFFGSLAQASISQLSEFWHGLVNSGHPFLWVLRPDVILCEEGEHVIVPQELQKGANEKGLIVDWARQEQVLGHDSIGGFLTHCGWNSILESIVARIPLICWPQTSDQNINADLVSNVLGAGLELEACDRLIVRRAVENLMGSKREELQNSIDRIAKCAQDVIGAGGSSIHNLGILVEDIKKIKLESQNVE